MVTKKPDARRHAQTKIFLAFFFEQTSCTHKYTKFPLSTYGYLKFLDLLVMLMNIIGNSEHEAHCGLLDLFPQHQNELSPYQPLAARLLSALASFHPSFPQIRQTED